MAEFSLDGRLLANRASAKLLPLKRSISNTRLIAETAARAAQEFQIGRYDVFGAAAAPFGGLPKRQGVFCSFLVAAAYAKARLNIANKLPRGTPPR